MIVLKATQEQYEALNGYSNGVSVLSFSKDAADNWIIGPNVLTDPAFEGIADQLAALEEIEFNPIMDEEE